MEVRTGSSGAPNEVLHDDLVHLAKTPEPGRVSTERVQVPTPRVVRAKASRFRPDIEGLRAVAVLLVVLNHLRLWPDGGFVGVDVFFTISGFLITGLIVDEVARTGWLSFRSFYTRRARRILPAALAALAGTWVAASVVFTGSRVESTVHDIWWSLGFAANIHFANAGTSYFDTYAEPSLVQHFWSLAVEEQFYLVWPVLVLVTTLVARKVARPRAGLVVIRLCGAAVAASLVWCVVQTLSAPAAAYFSTLGRAWELGAGALVALAIRRGVRLPTRLAGPASLAGVVGILASAAVIDGRSPFPGPAAVTPVLASCLVLLAGAAVTRFGSGWHVLLVNPASRFLGRVSFSLYLWHWPTILVVSALVPRTAFVHLPLTVSAMAALTLLSYHEVELRFHHAGSSGKVAQEVSKHGNRVARGPVRRRRLAVAATVALTLVLFALRPDSATPPALAAAAPAGQAAGPATASLQKQLTAALAATEWPPLTPAMSTVIAYKEFDDRAGCADSVPLLPASACTVGSPAAAKLALVVGDSTARAYMQTLKHFVDRPGSSWRIRFIGLTGCPSIDAEIPNKAKWITDACPARKQAALDVIRHDKPDLVIVTNHFLDAVTANSTKPMAVEDWASALERYTSQFRKDTKKVAYLAPPPAEIEISSCYTTFSRPADCISHVTQTDLRHEAAVRAIAQRQDGAYIESAHWFCVSGLCPAFVGSTASKADVVHMSIGYANAIAPAVLEAFHQQGLFTDVQT